MLCYKTMFYMSREFYPLPPFLFLPQIFWSLHIKKPPIMGGIFLVRLAGASAAVYVLYVLDTSSKR